MAEAVSRFLHHYFSSGAVVFLISLLPILELRGGMIAASLFGVPWLKAILISLFGNMLPIPFVILFIQRILRLLQEHGPIKSFAKRLENKAVLKGSELQAKYPKQLYIGLLLFVAIPIPGTGAWTGALVASVLGLKARKAALALCLGVIGAGLIMSFLAYALPAALGLK